MAVRPTAMTATVVLLLLMVYPALADYVYLGNGDRLSGTITGMSPNDVMIDTPYAGVLRIDRRAVVDLESEAPVDLILYDDTQLSGRILEVRDHQLMLAIDSTGRSRAVPFRKVRALNPLPAAPVQIMARFNVGLTVEDGNTEVENYHLDGEFTARIPKKRYKAGGEWNKQRANEGDTVDNWLAYADYRYYLLPKWYLLANTLLESDEFADLDLRTTLGGGFGYQFFEFPDLNLSAETGISYVYEDYICAEDIDFAALQWGIDYDQEFFDGSIQLFHRNFGFMRFDDTANWRLQTRQGIRHPIFRGFTATLQYNYDYDHKPSPDAETNWDWKLLFLLGYQFGE